MKERDGCLATKVYLSLLASMSCKENKMDAAKAVRLPLLCPSTCPCPVTRD